MKKLPVKFGKHPGFPCRIRFKPAPKSRKRRRKLSRQRWRKIQTDAEAIEITRIYTEQSELGFLLQFVESFDKRTQTWRMTVSLVNG